MIEQIIQDIALAFLEYLAYNIVITVMLTGLLYIFMTRIYTKSSETGKPVNYGRYVMIGIFIFYCLNIITITLLSREAGSRDSFDLRLFSTFSNNMDDNRYPIENILLFIPLGCFLPFFWKRFSDPLLCLAGGFGISTAIELVQFITKRGFLQIDDILTNTIGTMLGYSVLIVIKRIRNKQK